MLGFLNIMLTTLSNLRSKSIESVEEIRSQTVLIDAHSHIQEIKDFCLDQVNGTRFTRSANALHSFDRVVLPVVCGYSNSSNQKALEIGKRLSLPYVLGIAPQTTLREDTSKLVEWVELIKKSKPNAIGEIGLDYYWAKSKEGIEKEKRVFIEMLFVADSMNLPIVVHSRNATSDVLRIIKDHGFSKPVMFHFYSGSLMEAEEAIDIGAMISFTPLHSKERTSIINTIALENILVETDAPFVCRHPREVVGAVQYISEVKKLDYEIVANHTTKNAMNFFRITL